MSIFFDFEVGPSGKRFRRAVDGDKDDIKSFMSVKSEKLFGVVDIGELIELATLSICMIDEAKDVVGFMVVCDFPNVPVVDPADWETWMRNMFQEEDNDDIVEILDKTSPRLKDLYGNYYVSEIIGRHPESNRKIIVADHQDKAVGVMCLNSDVNYQKLEARYELCPFYGLRRATPLEKEQAKRANTLLSTFGDPIMKGKWSPFQRMVKIETHHSSDNVRRENHTKVAAKKTSKVNFGRTAALRKSLDHIIYRHHQSDDYSDKVYVDSPTHSQATAYSVTDLLDADPFDYEIVNIDKEFLTIPKALSCEQLNEQHQCWRQIKLSEINKRRMSRSSISNLKQTENRVEVVYHGEPNAFIIELFGFRDDINDRHGLDLLQAAFEVMKNYDYCIIRVPCKDKVFSLLQHFCFVPTKPKICSQYALYVAHRSSVLGKLRVREIEIADVPQIAMLLQDMEGQETVWTIENTILNKDQYLAYVFMSGLSIVGFGILEPSEGIDFIRAKFNVDLYHKHKYHFRGHGSSAGFSTLKVAHTYPAFERHYRFFIREMMRLSGSSSLLWLTAYRNKWVARKANSLVSAMIPLVPRKSEIDCTSISELKKINILSNKINAFSSWFLGKKMTTIPKVDVNTRIVVVGSSRTAMAFLDTLLFSDASSYLNFTNVTLISPNGLPYTRQTNMAAEMMFPKYRTMTDKFMKSVPYTYYTNVLQGTMVEIDKRDKYITLNNGNKYYYDSLFLLLGKQYQHPHYLAELDEKKELENEPYVRLDVPRVVDSDAHFVTEVLPDNVFIVNNITQANHAINYVRNIMVQDFNYKIIVYGESIHAYCCLASLLELKVPAENIVFVEPFPSEDNRKTRVPVFCNDNVDQTIKEVLKDLNITVHRSYHFQSWTVDAFNTVTHVEFLSYFQAINLECTVFFYYGKKGVSPQALNGVTATRELIFNNLLSAYNIYPAITKSGLVYDAGILINHEFKTKDPSIYAAGPATRYYRRYYADAYRLKYYDSYEVGEMLGTKIRNQLDPLFSPKKSSRRRSVRFSMQTASNSTSSTSHPSSENSKQTTSRSLSSSSEEGKEDRIPKLKKPIVTHCYLPGGLQYLEVRPPGKMEPHYYVQSMQYNGYVMETFKDGYFKLHMTNDHVVDGITCLSPEKTSLDNFKNLYGLPASVLNNVHVRYTTKKLDDFYSFFRSPWAFYLYHERVDELFAVAKELLPKGQRKGITLKEALQTVGETLSNPSFRFNTRMRIRSKFEQSPHVEAITDYVIEWLSDNDVLLPMYLQPEMQADLARDLERHPAFKKKNSFAKLVRNIF